MAISCSILDHMHLMVGIDFHDTIPPFIPVPSPHAVVMVTNGFNTSVIKSANVKSMTFQALNRGTDIGMGIPHIPLTIPNPLAILHTLASGSKSEFGAMTVHVNGSPVAIACLFVVNLNLNCQGPITPPWMPMPTGIVLAPSRNKAGFGIGDLMAGLFFMATDMLIQLALNKIGGKLGPWLGNHLSRLVGPYVIRYMVPFVFTRFPSSHNAILNVTRVLIENLPGTLAGIFGLGSPVGYSPDYTPVGGAGVVGDVQDRLGRGIAGLFTDAEVEDF